MSEKKEYMTLSPNRPEKPNELSADEKEYINTLINLFIIKLSELTKLNFIQWKRTTTNYFANWGIFEITLWHQGHFHISNTLNNDIYETNEDNPYLKYLKENLDIIYESKIIDMIYFTMYSDLAELNTQDDKKRRK